MGHCRTMASFAMPFSVLVCMHTRHLATNILLLKIAELETQPVCMEMTEKGYVIQCDLVFEQMPG